MAAGCEGSRVIGFVDFSIDDDLVSASGVRSAGFTRSDEGNFGEGCFFGSDVLAFEHLCGGFIE